MYSKNILHWRRLIGHHQPKAAAFASAAGLLLLFLLPIQAAPLMEEGFNYPSGSNLATNLPWAGTGNASLAVANGSLSLTNLRSTSPTGNSLQLNGGATANARRTFSTTAISNGMVYCSFLVNCAAPPTNQQFVLSLLRSGATSASPPDDPLDVFVRPLGVGYAFTITSGGSDPASANVTLATNTTHLIVVKYIFGTVGRGSLYLDPVPGGNEPNPNTSTSSDDNVGSANLQVILFRSTAGPSSLRFDTVRVGTNWSEVTPLTAPLNLDGPQDQAVCSGSPATFTVTANGTAPYFYQWRMNGNPVPGATNNNYQLSAPAANATVMGYDVVVQDGFGSVTSRVASLVISTMAASIVAQPTNLIVTPVTSNAVFTVTAAGDDPLRYQWRTNGFSIPGATNTTYALTNPTTADPSLQYDVIVSNPCGAVTSGPPVSLLFPSVFYLAYDAGPGFFSGENLVVTNRGGLALQAWSSDSLSVPVAQWSLEGSLQEQPLNDGSGKSFYSLNVNPAISPTYYIFGAGVSPPYLAPIPTLAVSLDPGGFYILASSPMAISPDGLLTFPATQLSITPHPGEGFDLIGAGVAGNTYLLEATTNLRPPIQWITVQTNVADGSGSVQFSETNRTLPLRWYRMVGQ